MMTLLERSELIEGMQELIDTIKKENILQADPGKIYFDSLHFSRLAQEVADNLGQLILEVTEECNLRCSYCVYNEFVSDSRNHGSRRMELSTAHKAIEYMAVGLPAVCSPVGMNLELIEPGVSGFLPAAAKPFDLPEDRAGQVALGEQFGGKDPRVRPEIAAVRQEILKGVKGIAAAVKGNGTEAVCAATQQALASLIDDKMDKEEYEAILKGL